MKNHGFVWVAILALAASVFGGTAMATGNGAPSGSHYNLNLIGVPKDKSGDPGGNGHRIFVPLEGQTRIMLTESADFQVIDADGTDGRAEFGLPNPDPENDGVTWYSVYARALGKPGGNGSMTTCAEWLNPETGEYETVCSMAVLSLERKRGKSTFENVTRELLYIYVDLDGDGVAERYNLFNDALQDYFWQYDNNGLKVVQLRFYEIPTDVN